MKPNVIALLSLSLLVAHTHSSLAKNKIKIREKIDLFKKKILDTKTKVRQPKQNNQEGYPRQPVRPGGYHQYPAYPAAGYPAPGSPYAGGYGGGYMNYNPNNRVLSPHYGGSFGYGGYGGVGGGSPFSHQVQAMGMYPSDRSKGFGRSAVIAAGGGAMAGMALGYGLGRFPRPHFSFRSPQEEYYYNHYMYRKYGVKSTDNNDYGRDYWYSQPSLNYDRFMDSCTKRVDLIPAKKPQANNKPGPTITTKFPTAPAAPAAPAAPDTEARSNSTSTNTTVAGRPLSAAASALPPVNERRNSATDDDDDDTVSIVEIGYPALIRDLKVRRCVELYMAYSEKYFSRRTEAGRAPSLEAGLKGPLAVASALMLLILQH